MSLQAGVILLSAVSMPFATLVGYLLGSGRWTAGLVALLCYAIFDMVYTCLYLRLIDRMTRRK